MMKANILGTEYEIVKKKYDEDVSFAEKSRIGYCDDLAKQIVYADAKTFPNWENETDEVINRCNKETLRHEIIHAFFNESGLKDCANGWNGAWVKNEEMIDFFAIQFPKIVKVYEELKII